ncbi:hypothetical protein Tco_0404388 [Tanacetum coccineum]
MSSNTPDYIYPIIVPSDSDVEDAFSSTNTPDYTPASPDYSPASPGNTSSDPSEDLSKDLLASLAISPFHDDPYMKVMQAYNATSNESPIPPPRAPIAPPTVLPPSPVFEIGESSYKTHLECHEEQIETILNHLDELPLERIGHMENKIEGLEREQIRHDDEIVLARIRISTLDMIIEDIQIYVCHGCFLKPLYPSIMDMINDQDIEHMTPPTPPKDIEPPVGSPISLSPSSLITRYGSYRNHWKVNQSPRNLMSQMLVRVSIFGNLRFQNFLLYSAIMAPKRTSTSAAPTMTQAAIRKLVADSVSAALEAQAATMANTDNTNRNTGPKETHVAIKINCTEDYKVKFATGTLTEEALSWWNSFAQPIGIEEAYKIP